MLDLWMTSRVVYTRVPTNKWVHCHGCAGSRWQGLSVSLKSPGLLLNTTQVNGACLFIVELSPGHSMTIAVLNQQWAVITHRRAPHCHPRWLGLRAERENGLSSASLRCRLTLWVLEYVDVEGCQHRDYSELLAHQPGLVCWECLSRLSVSFTFPGRAEHWHWGEPRVIVLMSGNTWQWLSELPECESAMSISAIKLPYIWKCCKAS